MVVSHAEIFFGLFILCCWNMYCAVVAVRQTSSNELGIPPVGNQIYMAMASFMVLFKETGQKDMINELQLLDNCHKENEGVYYEFITEFLDNDAIDDLLLADLFEVISNEPEKKHFLPQRRP